MDICTRELPSLENDREVFAKQHSHDNEGLKKNKFVVSIYNQCRPHMKQLGHAEATGNQSVGWKNHISRLLKPPTADTVNRMRCLHGFSLKLNFRRQRIFVDASSCWLHHVITYAHI